MKTQLQDGQTLLFIGDSITDCGRREAAHSPLGNGYVKMLSDLLTVREPAKKIQVINRGIGGNTVDDLRSRWQEDVLSHRPEWLSIKIGINDLNRHLCRQEPLGLTPEMFSRIYRELLTLTKEKLPECRLLLISPFYISRDTLQDSYRARVLQLLPEYVQAVAELHREFQTRYVPLHEIFQAQLEHRHPDDYCPEPVHPHETGHLLMAEAVYCALAE